MEQVGLFAGRLVLCDVLLNKFGVDPNTCWNPGVVKSHSSPSGPHLMNFDLYQFRVHKLTVFNLGSIGQ